MSDGDEFPYTDEQVEAVVACYRKAFCANIGGGKDPDDTYYRDETRDLLAALHHAGITVSFPEPRYYTVEDAMGWHVIDREDGAAVAKFWKPNSITVSVGHPDPEGAAKAEADRLNREHGHANEAVREVRRTYTEARYYVSHDTVSETVVDIMARGQESKAYALSIDTRLVPDRTVDRILDLLNDEN